MRIMHCPLNGPRNISEFVCFGEVKAQPDPAAATDREWADYLFLEDNTAGVVEEYWLHAPTNFWFVARRDTVSDEILETMTLDAFRALRGPAKGTGSVGGENVGGDADAGGMGMGGSE